MKKNLCFLTLFLLSSILFAAKKPVSPELVVKIIADKKNALYKIGDTAKFTITITDNGKPLKDAKVSYVLSKDSVAPFTKGVLNSENPKIITATLNEPGFMMLKVTVKTNDKRYSKGVGGAGFEPLKIKPSLKMPDDFKQFWETKKAAQAKIPMKPIIVLVKTTEKINLYDVNINCLGKIPVSSYFAKPKNAKKKSLPAILRVQGAGVRSASKAAVTFWANKGAMAMDLNAHGVANGKEETFYNKLKKEKLRGYPKFGRKNRETSYFLGMLLRVVRALEFLKSQPEWDGKILVVTGSSQGGAQALAAAGLDSKVTAINAGVPGLCDHTGMLVKRTAGWPRIIPIIAGKPHPEILKTAPYFDCVNFAQLAKAKAMIRVGFLDGTCAPTSVYAAFNAYKGPKEIVNMIQTGHGNSAKYVKKRRHFLLKAMGLK